MDKADVAECLKELRFIYETLMPGQGINLHLFVGDPVANPAVLHKPGWEMPIHPEVFARPYLGRYRIGDETVADEDAYGLEVTLPANWFKMAHPRLSTRKRARYLRKLGRLDPVLAEYLRFRLEKRNFERMPERHNFESLPYEAPMVQIATRTASDKAPAILIGLHWLDVGGAESLGLDTINWALELGLRVFVVLDRPGVEGLMRKLPDDENLHLIRNDLYLPRPLANDFIDHLVAQENIILTHNHHCGLLYDALPVLKLKHPHVVNIDSTHIVEYGDGGYPRVSGVWSKFLDYHHVISEDLRTFYLERFQTPADKLILGRLLKSQETDPLPSEPRIKAGQTRCRVAFVGRLVHQKRPLLVVEIMKQLYRWGTRVGVAFEFDMVGEGAYEPFVQALLKRHGLQDAVRCHPAGTDVPALFSQSDILLLPSSNEGLALVCYEAISAGCIAISSDVGGQSEICAATALVPWSPYGALRESQRIVKALLQKPGFAESVFQAQLANFRKIREDTRAKDVISSIYRDVQTKQS